LLKYKNVILQSLYKIQSVMPEVGSDLIHRISIRTIKYFGRGPCNELHRELSSKIL